MGFGVEGTIPVTITDARMTDCRFDEGKAYANSFDIALLCQADDGQSDWWHGECSQRMGIGKAANKTQLELTQATLGKLGLNDLSQFMSLVGMKTVVETKRSQCGKYCNIKYIGGGSFAAEALDANTAQQRMQALLSAPAQQPAQFQQAQGQQFQQQPQQFNGGQQQPQQVNQQPAPQPQGQPQQGNPQQQFQFQQPQQGQAGHAG